MSAISVNGSTNCSHYGRGDAELTRAQVPRVAINYAVTSLRNTGYTTKPFAPMVKEARMHVDT